MPKDIIYFYVSGKPRGKGRPRFTRYGKPYTPKETVDYEKAVQAAWWKASDGYSFGDRPVEVQISAHYPMPKAFTKAQREQAEKGEIRPKTKPDVDNIAKIILDALNGKAFDDDNKVVSLMVDKRYTLDTDGYVAVYLSEWKPIDILTRI